MTPMAPDQHVEHPVTAAASLLEDVVSQHRDAHGHLAARDLLEVVKAFRSVTFDVPDVDDADGFLFQYGPTPASPPGTPAFTIGFARQLEVVNDDSEHECYVQVSVECRYDEGTELVGSGPRSLWWFPGEQQTFEQWLELVRTDPIWSEIEHAGPVVPHIEQDTI